MIAVILLVDALALALWLQWRRENRFDSRIKFAAEKYGIDPALVKAVVWRESKFKPEVRGKAGEIGLMQIRDLAANEWAQAEKIPDFHHENIIDAQTNTLAGAWYLARLLKRYQGTDNPVPFALADYNAGRTRVLKWLTGAGKTNQVKFMEQMDYPGTKNYIVAITNRAPRYRRDFPVAMR